MTTYTPIARLPIMTPGDAAVKNAWGAIFDAMMPLIEQVAAGVATIDLSGLTSLVLSANNNAADQSRAQLLNFVGTPTGACIVTIPSVARGGLVANATSQPITLTTPSATTQLTVPAGIVFVYVCDGQNVSALNVSGPGLLLSLGGALIANGTYYSAYNSSGTPVSLLGMGADNFADLYVGPAGLRLTAPNSTAGFVTVTPAGNVTFSGNVSIPTGGISANTLASTGVTASGGGFLAAAADPGGFYYRMISGSYGSGLVNDGVNTSILVSRQNAQSGPASSLRPVSVNNNSGVVTIDGTGAGATFGGPVTFGGKITAASGIIQNLDTSTLTLNSLATTTAQIGPLSITATTVGSSANISTPSFTATSGAVSGNFTAGSIGCTSLSSSTAALGPLTITASVVASTSNISASSFTASSAAISGNFTAGTIGCDTLNSGVKINAASIQAASEAVSGNFTAGTVGVAGVCQAASFVTTSDGRLKQAIADISDEQAYQWVAAGRPRTYTMHGHPSAGFVAQEDLQSVRASAVVPVADDRPEFAESDGFAAAGMRLGRQTDQDIAYLTKVVQGLMKRLTSLEAQLATA